VTECYPAKTGEYPSDSPQFLKSARVAKKYLKDNKHSSLHLAPKYARKFVLGHYLFPEAHSFHMFEKNYRVKWWPTQVRTLVKKHVLDPPIETEIPLTLRKIICPPPPYFSTDWL